MAENDKKEKRLTSMFLAAAIGIGGGYMGMTLLKGELPPQINPPAPIEQTVTPQQEFKRVSSVTAITGEDENNIGAKQSWLDTNERLPWNIRRMIHENDRQNLLSALSGFDGGKETAMFIAAQDPMMVPALKFLIENGADIHAEQDKALRFAAYFGNVEGVRYLLKKGADPQALDGEALFNATSSQNDGRYGITNAQERFQSVEKMLRDALDRKGKTPRL